MEKKKTKPPHPPPIAPGMNLLYKIQYTPVGRRRQFFKSFFFYTTTIYRSGALQGRDVINLFARPPGPFRFTVLGQRSVLTVRRALPPPLNLPAAPSTTNTGRCERTPYVRVKKPRLYHRAPSTSPHANTQTYVRSKTSWPNHNN